MEHLQKVITCLDAKLKADKVDVKGLAEAMQCFLQGPYTEQAKHVHDLHQAMFIGDEDTPGLVPLARRISTWLDGACKLLNAIITIGKLIVAIAAIGGAVTWFVKYA